MLLAKYKNLITKHYDNSSFSQKWINGLDSLRFILALIVLLSHLHLTKELVGSTFIMKVLRLFVGNIFVGVAAVITFFIISGIVIHLPYKEKNQIDNTINYLVRRYLRIAIPMIGVILIAFAFNLKTHIFPFWSLYCELFYYTIFPLLILLIRKIGINKLLICSFVISYTVIFIYSNSISDFFSQNKTYDGNYWQLGFLKTSIVGLSCWLLGVKIAEELNKLKSHSVTIKKIYLIRTVVLITAFLCSVARFHLSLSYLLSLNIFALLAYYWIKQEIIFWKDRQPIALLENAGKWSYSLYLCHALGIIWVSHIFPDNHAWYILLLQGISSLVISYLFYLLVEKPSHHFIRKIKFSFF